MRTHDGTRRSRSGPFTPDEETVAAALAAVALVVETDDPDGAREHERDWDAVYDAALESFPASDAPSWSSLRVGPPTGDRPTHAAG